MHSDSFIHFPLAAVWISSPTLVRMFESGSWFFGTLLPYLGVAAACLQLCLLFRKWRRRS